MSDDGTPEGRLAAAARLFLEQMPPELVQECHTLVELDPSSAGVRVHYLPEEDMYALVWVGRWLGSVAGTFVREGAS